MNIQYTDININTLKYKDIIMPLKSTSDCADIKQQEYILNSDV